MKYNIYGSFWLGGISALLFLTGCTGYYEPKMRQPFETGQSFEASGRAFGSQARFVLMDGHLWLQHRVPFLIEGRHLTLTFDANETVNTTRYLVLPSDHPLGSYSNVLFDIDMVRERNQTQSLEYRCRDPRCEFGAYALSGSQIELLQEMARQLDADQTQTVVGETNGSTVTTVDLNDSNVTAPAPITHE